MVKSNKRRYQPPLGYSMSRAILDILLDIGETLPLFESPYAHIKRLHREVTGAPVPSMWRYNRAMRYLEYRKCLKIKKEGDRVFIQLTKKGKLNALLERIARSEKTTGKWDGKWRIIIWDIPESSYPQRNRLRHFVKNLGFCKLQYSVFIRPYAISGEAVSYLKESGLMKFIRILRVDRVDDDEFLREHFGLKK